MVYEPVFVAYMPEIGAYFKQRIICFVYFDFTKYSFNDCFKEHHYLEIDCYPCFLLCPLCSFTDETQYMCHKKLSLLIRYCKDHVE